MKAGLQVSVQEIELCGGNNDTVPRQIIDPENGAIYDTAKYYWCNAPTKGMKKDDLKLMVDTRGNQYGMDYRGFVAVAAEQTEEESEGSENQAQG
jgi:hypothetical protein